MPHDPSLCTRGTQGMSFLTFFTFSSAGLNREELTKKRAGAHPVTLITPKLDAMPALNPGGSYPHV